MKQLFTLLFLALFIQNVSAQKPDALPGTQTNALNISVVCLLVNDYDKAIEYYTNKLGFVVAADMKYGENQRWVSLKMPSGLPLELSLGLAKTEVDKQVVGRQGGSYPFFVLVTNDFNATYEKYKSLGVEFLGEPQKSPRGTGVTFKDLYGNVIYLKDR
jgi:catechol 2,3-dioxygenase-like lactoylglutathione lyase family enzyme